MDFLSMRHIRKSFAGVSANDDISLDVGPSEIHALLGENGAGKTTLMNILYGIYSADSGEILWKGRPLGAHEPRDAIQSGIGMVHQHFMLVPTLTVSKNITLGMKSPGHPFPKRQILDRAIVDISRTYGLDVDPEAKVSSLSVGEQQRVEILKLLYRKAELLILDEPTAVLTPTEVESLFDVLRRLKEEGRSVILITHRIPEVRAIADKITVLRDGACLGTSLASEVSAEELSRRMIGRELVKVSARARKAPSADRAPPGLELDSVNLVENGLFKLRNVKLKVEPGEILGIAGVDGNGQKELAECILGLRRPNSGSVFFNGKRVEGLGVSERKHLGLAYVPDDRLRDALILEMSLAENYLLESLAIPGFVSRGFVDSRKCRKSAESAVRTYRIKSSGIGSAVRLMSGGNQQKLVLARCLAHDPAIIVASQPTRGLDIGAAEFVRERLLERRASACTVLLISADLDEILQLSDRMAVIYRGAVSEAIENGPDIDMTRIGLLMAGHAGAERQ